MSASAVAIVAYVLGIVLLAIGFGFFKQPKEELSFDTQDYIMFTTLALACPALLFVGVCIGLPAAAVGYAVYFAVKWLLNVGEGIYCWWEERKEAKEAKEAEDEA